MLPRKFDTEYLFADSDSSRHDNISDHSLAILLLQTIASQSVNQLTRTKVNKKVTKLVSQLASHHASQ